ncbi:hypothetical protein P3X46_012337 [Hevea brasiliensis]|uniref:TPX2 C-terminal domain-containing protein n=1 Tax=Hevea brasiliensis TaxID=3981 RepID=A0ABQ9MDK5_HEVBR|nr:hypothetical protein P3X46_012337 [Hevea brasiliensis]
MVTINHCIYVPICGCSQKRGAEKERKFVMDLMQKQLEEERARIPQANPYPYTTDYSVSLVRHEDEMQREMEERQRNERKEANNRIFKANPRRINLYKRFREESEAARMKEKALKQLRRTMAPHARPVPNFDQLPRKPQAKSPNLRVLRRKERQRMINNAVSSPASCIR